VERPLAGDLDVLEVFAGSHPGVVLVVLAGRGDRIDLLEETSVPGDLGLVPHHDVLEHCHSRRLQPFTQHLELLPQVVEGLDVALDPVLDGTAQLLRVCPSATLSARSNGSGGSPIRRQAADLVRVRASRPASVSRYTVRAGNLPTCSVRTGSIRPSVSQRRRAE
jgi:hypothetical protein